MLVDVFPVKHFCFGPPSTTWHAAAAAAATVGIRRGRRRRRRGGGRFRAFQVAVAPFRRVVRAAPLAVVAGEGLNVLDLALEVEHTIGSRAREPQLVLQPAHLHVVA